MYMYNASVHGTAIKSTSIFIYSLSPLSLPPSLPPSLSLSLPLSLSPLSLPPSLSLPLSPPLSPPSLSPPLSPPSLLPSLCSTEADYVLVARFSSCVCVCYSAPSNLPSELSH